jgi:hypothetical protein
MDARDVLGVDLSLTATGLADREGASVFTRAGSGIQRSRAIAEEVARWALGKRLVVMEHFGHLRGPAVFIIEVHGIVKYLLDLEGIPLAVVTPPSLKKFATGKGTAGKGEMLSVAIRRHNFVGFDDNAVDAFWLRQMGLAHFGFPTTVYQAEAMTKVAWPDLGRREGVREDAEDPGLARDRVVADGRAGDLADSNRDG